jgi:hypothetical protein
LAKFSDSDGDDEERSIDLTGIPKLPGDADIQIKEYCHGFMAAALIVSLVTGTPDLEFEHACQIVNGECIWD